MFGFDKNSLLYQDLQQLKKLGKDPLVDLEVRFSADYPYSPPFSIFKNTYHCSTCIETTFCLQNWSCNNRGLSLHGNTYVHGMEFKLRDVGTNLFRE